MFRIFLVLILTFNFIEITFANAKTELDKVIKSDVLELPSKNDSPVIKKQSGVFEKKFTKKPMTNYQYDESYYHYQKINTFIQDNINYAKSGRMKY